MERITLGVLASGRGSNFKAILSAVNDRKLNAKIGVVISDNPEAKALDHASVNNIPAICINPVNYKNKPTFEAAVAETLISHNTDLVILAGFMRILSGDFLKSFSGRVMNIHPSLLPSFPGKDAQRQALEHGVKIAGCTVHFVDEGVDSGPIILQKAVQVLENDTVESLSQRILTAEHNTYHEAISLYAAGKLKIENGRVRIIDI